MTILRAALAACLFAGAVSAPSIVKADEEMSPLAQSGNWIALAHSASMLAHPDMCLAAAVTSPSVAFRKDAETFQLRVVDKSWSLPAGVKGSLTLTVGQWSHTFDIDDNTDDSINAEIDNVLTGPMFAAMDKAPSMTVKVGNAKPFSVSLAGSTIVTNAFRTCAGISSHADTPGSNPFSSN